MTSSELPSNESEIEGGRESFLWTGNGAFLFPGQGAQKKGMGFELFNNFPRARGVFEMADRILGYSISDICFNNTDNKLAKTEYAQPASAVVDIAAYYATLEVWPQLEFSHPVAGEAVSFGELPHLVVAGVMDLESLLSITKRRGAITNEVGNDNPGKMVAVLRLEREHIVGICKESGVWPAIYYPGITVISGGLKEIEDASALCKEKGARIIETGVDYAFHTPLMEPAKEPFREILAPLEFKDPSYTVILNPGVRATTSGREIKRYLPEGLTNPVDAIAMVAAAEALGAKVFLEFCPQPVLSNHLKRGNPEIKVASVYDFLSVQGLNLSF